MFRSLAYASRPVCMALLLAGLCGLTAAQSQQTVSGIYTCTDARGRKLTSDRPIAECIDREQKVLNPSGTIKARVGPTLTAQERIELEVQEKTQLGELTRLNEEKRRDRALRTRYPNQAVHDKERAEALAQLKVVRQALVNRVEDLRRQREAIFQEIEFYAKDPTKAPPAINRQLDEVSRSLAAQERFVADQDAEFQRVNARFDEELVRLKQGWVRQSPGPMAAASKTR